MKRLRLIAVYGVLVTLALALGLSTNQAAPPPSPRPSVDNPGPVGLRALYLYLQESGAPVSASRRALDETREPVLTEGLRTLVVAAPTGRPVTPTEARALRAWVSRGGTLVYLVAREAAKRPSALEDWLPLSDAALLPASAEGLPPREQDLTGTTVRVWGPVGAERGLERLRVSLDKGLSVERLEAVPVAGARGVAAVWRVPEGKGEVYVLAGPDLAENRRLELLDNLRFWDALAARGPLAFDEYHQELAPAAEPPSARALWLFVAQGLVVGLLYVASRGTRFGPPRPLLEERHRSSLEYVRSLGWLARRARVERELLPELGQQLRRRLHERLGISAELSEEEAARLWEQRGGPGAEEYLALREELVRTAEQREVRPADYARLVRRYARMERLATGLDATATPPR